MKRVEKESVIDFLPGTVAIEGYLQFEHVFLCKTYYFRFRLLQLNYRRCLTGITGSDANL
jgi:hypothetical protein